MARMNLMLTTTLQDRLRRASARTGLEPAEMVRCAISEWLQRLEQPVLPFASADPSSSPRADASPLPPTAPEPTKASGREPTAARKRSRRRAAGQEEKPDA